MQEMLRQAAIVTNERGNRRYHDWLFQVDGSTVVSMQHFNYTKLRIPSQTNLAVYQPCAECEGSGCAACGHVGEVHVIYGNGTTDPGVAY